VIISVHIPKTAGTSLGWGLRDRFGDRLLEDYADRPLSDTPEDDARRQAARAEVRLNGAKLLDKYDAVHGHFIADKYATLPGEPLFCVVLRDPVDRAASHYRQWTELPNPVNVMSRKVIEEGLDLAAFTALPGQANLYGTFLGRMPLERFAVVGLTEAYEETLKLFEAVTGVAVPGRADNVAARKPSFNGADRDALATAQPGNMRLYDQARRRFDMLCRRYGVV
jgi:hypothetical protein